jgi:hypothetical protein
MRNQDHQIVNLFDGCSVPQGCRGRRSQPSSSTHPRGWAMAWLCVLVFGLTSAATAITVKNRSHVPQEGFSESYPAHFKISSGWNGFDAVLY